MRALIGVVLWLSALSGMATNTAAADVGFSRPFAAANLDPTTIPADATGSLTFHNLADYQGPGTRPGDLPNGAVPVPGVVFTITRIDGVDLTTSAGWALARTYMNGGIELARQHLGATITTAPSGTDGIIRVTGLPIGLYLIHEDVSASTSLPDPGVVPSADFLVTVPMAEPTSGSSWIFDLDIYPKRTHVSLTKSVDDGHAGVADQDAPIAGRVLTYNLEATLPIDGLRSYGGQCERNGQIDDTAGLDEFGFDDDGMCASGAAYVGVAAGAAFEIIDDLTTSVVPGTNPPRSASDFLEFAAADWIGRVTVTLSARQLTPCPPSVTTGCDYVLTRSASRVSISLVDRGLAALAAAKAESPDAVLGVAIQARVRDTVTAATISSVISIPNTALLIPNGLAKELGFSVPSNTVVTIYASLRLHKIDNDTGASLAGAVFTLYRTRADAVAGRDALAVSAPTGAGGVAHFDGLHVTDYQNDGPDDDSYWIVESVAPSGYIGVGGPMLVRVNSDGVTLGADASGGVPVPNPRQGSTTTTVLPTTTIGPTPTTAPNPPTSVPDRGPLPWTGANVYWLLGIGIALIAMGATVAAAARRRRHEPHPQAGGTRR